MDNRIKILVVFVEPMLYGMDLIREVYEKTPYEYKYVYCDSGITGKDDIELSSNAVMCSGNRKERKRQILKEYKEFMPNFSVINGYVGVEQTVAIKYCKKKKIPYAIETDTPLHIPSNRLKAFAKKIYLKTLLHNRYCFGFPGGTLQKENLVYYGIIEEKNFIMPMSVSGKRLLEVSEKLPSKNILKESLGFGTKKIFLFVGRLEKVKNVTLLLKSFNEVKKEEKECALLIVGDGSEMNILKEIVLQEQISDVYFAGYVVFPEIIKYYKVADAFVLPSTYEPWGLVVNEAMIMGLPVLVSSHVGCRVDLIREGVNGFIFQDNDKKDLKEKMLNTLYLNTERRIIDEWSYDTYLKKFIVVVEDICKKLA